MLTGRLTFGPRKWLLTRLRVQRIIFSNRLPWAHLADVSGVRWADPGQEVHGKETDSAGRCVNLTSVRFRWCSVNKHPCKNQRALNKCCT